MAEREGTAKDFAAMLGIDPKPDTVADEEPEAERLEREQQEQREQGQAFVDLINGVPVEGERSGYVAAKRERDRALLESLHPGTGESGDE